MLVFTAYISGMSNPVEAVQEPSIILYFCCIQNKSHLKVLIVNDFCKQIKKIVFPHLKKKMKQA